MYGDFGLYGGAAGHAALFAALAEETHDPRVATWLADAVDWLERVATPAGGGLVYPANDVLYGNAGVILALLPLAGDKPRAHATALGDGLLARGERTPHGTRWLTRPNEHSELPNFFHGTAGVAFAFARLYEATRDSCYLEAALAGARHLLAIARTDGAIEWICDGDRNPWRPGLWTPTAPRTTTRSHCRTRASGRWLPSAP
ncbi:MAG: lanthionine synthetase LanC family protein [bacterium]